MPDAAELVHGTCVALGRSAALLRGPSGSGKSDLALRFLFLARRGPAALEPPTLVADDQVRIRREGDRLLVEAPATLRGKLEVRGLGIVEMKSTAEAELVLVADLVAAGEVERMPDAGAMGEPARGRCGRHPARGGGAVGPHQAGAGPGKGPKNLTK